MGYLHLWKENEVRKKGFQTEEVFLEKSKRTGKKGITSWMEETS